MLALATLCPQKACAFNPLGLLRDKHKMSVQLGYTNKQMVTDRGALSGGVVHENMLGNPNAYLHGVQAGWNLYLLQKLGFGVHTGVSLNVFYTGGDATDPSMHGYKRFMETEAYVPAHLMYRFSLIRKLSVGVYAGVGMNYGLFGSFTSSGAPWKDRNEVLKYGQTGWPERFGTQGEVGASLRMGTMELNVLYGVGLTNHSYYPGANTRQNRITVTIAKPF